MDLKPLLKINFLLLLLQNFYIYLAIALQNTNSNQDYFVYVFYLDIIFYCLLSVLLILEGVFDKNSNFLLSGLLFLVWIGVTLVWRVTLDIYSNVIDFSNSSSLEQTISTVSNYFMIAGFVFVIAIFFLSNGIKMTTNQKIIVNFYGVVNLISAIFSVAIIGLLPKVFLVPILGILAFYILIKEIGN